MIPTIKRAILSLTIFGTSIINGLCIAPTEIRWSDEASDTTTITGMLIKAAALRANSPSELIVPIGKMLLDTPYLAGGIEASPEKLTIRLDSLDCTTFVETVIAAAQTAYSGRTSWRDFAESLKEMRYRGSNVSGYASRLHYFSDWVVENTHRGNLIEATDRIANADHMVRTLDFMSRNREKYPALKDEANFNAIKNAEMGYRSHRFAYIKPINLKNTTLREGDIVGIVTSINGLDVTHLGLVTLVNGKPHLLHASSAKGKVMIDPLELSDYLKRSRRAIGIRVIRLCE